MKRPTTDRQITRPAARARQGNPPLSLSRRLTMAIVLPMAMFALAMGFGGAYVIENSVTAVNDRSLGAAARAISEALAVEDGELTLDLPPAAFGMLENNARDNIYYSIRHGRDVITGYADLPQSNAGDMTDTESRFADSMFRGQPIRMAIEARRLPGLSGPVIVQVAETTQGRRDAARQLRLGLAALEIGLIAIALLLIPIAVGWAIRPMSRLRETMENRPAADLSPLPDLQAPRELRPLVVAFNALLARLDEAMRGLRQFTADASHQMRTPLSILRTHVSVLQAAGVENPQARQSIADIDTATERLQRLLVQLLALARAENAQLDRRDMPPIQIVDHMREISAELAAEALRRGIDLVFDVDGETGRAGTTRNLNAELLRELVHNLIDNAIRYNGHGGTIWVRVRHGDPLRVEIEDDGPGIPTPDRIRVFERFTRLASDNDSPGSGLGLPIARTIATILGIDLSLNDRVDGTGLLARLTFGPPGDMSADPAG